MSSNSALITQLRQKALDMLQESSELFEQAFVLLQNDRGKEAEQMRESARAKRNDSFSLMQEAKTLEAQSVSPDNSTSRPTH